MNPTKIGNELHREYLSELDILQKELYNKFLFKLEEKGIFKNAVGDYVLKKDVGTMFRMFDGTEFYYLVPDECFVKAIADSYHKDGDFVEDNEFRTMFLCLMSGM